MNSYLYFNGAEGRRYCYSPRRTERCPVITYNDTIPALTPRGEEIAAALDAFGLDGHKTLLRTHRSTSFTEDHTCAACGARLDSVGFAAWIEAPWDQIPATNDNSRATRAINERLGGTHGRVPGSHRYFALRREAKAWAGEEAAIDRDAFRATLTTEGR